MDLFPIGPDVSAHIASATAMSRSTQKRVVNARLSKAEGDEFSRKTLETLRHSYSVLATVSEPFTTDSHIGQTVSSEEAMPIANRVQVLGCTGDRSVRLAGRPCKCTPAPLHAAYRLLTFSGADD